MRIHATLFTTLITLSLLAFITFTPGSHLAQLSLFVGSLFDITFYSPFDNQPIVIKHAYVEVGGHFSIFLLIGAIIRQWLVKYSFSTCVLTLLFLSAASELGQNLSVGRSTSWDDFAVNMLAGTVGIVISSAIGKHKEKQAIAAS